MAKIKDPVLFSKHFKIDATALERAGLIDPFLNVDTQLFIDPVLLEKSTNPRIHCDAFDTFCSNFKYYVRLLAISRTENDAAWKGARRLLNLREPPENGLGYGSSSRSGNSRPEAIRDVMMRTSKEIIELGADDPEMISLMGFFEEDVGPDTISDFTTRVKIRELAAITEDFCVSHGIPVSEDAATGGLRLPRYRDPITGHDKATVLVPTDIVRDLPIANDWSDIEQAAYANAEIRDRVNRLLAGIAKPTVADRKAALRRFALNSADDFERFLTTVKENAAYYDQSLDPLGYYKLKWFFAQDPAALKVAKTYDVERGPDALKDFVLDTVSQFKHHVENANLWEESWVGDKPKKERAAQLIYYAIADAFCVANDVDISPEANMGGGPIDFKFSKGYKARVLVEMKRSTGAVVHGYEKQLEIYKDASRTHYGIFVIMDYGNLRDKLLHIQRIRAKRLRDGEEASEIIVIDARRKASASRRT